MDLAGAEFPQGRQGFLATILRYKRKKLPPTHTQSSGGKPMIARRGRELMCHLSREFGLVCRKSGIREDGGSGFRPRHGCMFLRWIRFKRRLTTQRNKRALFLQAKRQGVPAACTRLPPSHFSDGPPGFPCWQRNTIMAWVG